jgi:hypothetical protein
MPKLFYVRNVVKAIFSNQRYIREFYASQKKLLETLDKELGECEMTKPACIQSSVNAVAEGFSGGEASHHEGNVTAPSYMEPIAKTALEPQESTPSNGFCCQPEDRPFGGQADTDNILCPYGLTAENMCCNDKTRCENCRDYTTMLFIPSGNVSDTKVT